MERTLEPHPLARRLADALRGRQARALVIGPGDGRSLPVLREAGLGVVTVPSDADLSESGEGYDGVLSTHALLHGTRPSVTRRVDEIRSRLASGGLLHATFGSINDPRYGAGQPVDGGAGWAPSDGPETGAVHAYFDESSLRAMLASYELLSCEEVDVRGIVGRWAHDPSDTAIVHWLVRARKR